MNFKYIESQEHISSIGIIEMMLKMREKYNKEKVNTAWSKFQSDLEVDPVLKFVDYVATRKPIEYYDIIENEEEEREKELGWEERQEQTERYIARYFYYIKGTKSILYKLEDFFGFEYDGDIEYTQYELNFRIKGESLSWVEDETEFIDYFRNFLLALIYLNSQGQDLINNIDTYGLKINIEINDSIDTKAELGSVVYNVKVVCK